jgi:hypothetical protein
MIPSPRSFAAVLVSLVACSSHVRSPPVPTIAGTLEYGGEWTHTRARAANEEWLAYSFEARAGDEVEAYVRSTTGSPTARLVDDGQRGLAESTIGHPDGDTIAVATFGAARTGTYYLLLRDAHDAAATFEVQLVGRFACRRDADCARGGRATGNATAPSPLDIVPYCLFADGEAAGSCKWMTRESVEQLGAHPARPGR